MGLPEVEGDLAGNGFALEFVEQFGDPPDAGFERPQELLLLGMDDALHLFGGVGQVGIGVAHSGDHLSDQRVQHRFAQAEQPGVARGAADQHLDDVAGAVVGRQHPIGDA